MSKLSKNQKELLKNIENDKSRETQKQQFKLQNKFDRKTRMEQKRLSSIQNEFDIEFNKHITSGVGSWVNVPIPKGTTWHEPINMTKLWKEKCLEMDKIIDKSELKEKPTWYSDSTKEQQVKMQKDLDRYLNFPNFPNNCESKLDTIQLGDRKETVSEKIDIPFPKNVSFIEKLIPLVDDYNISQLKNEKKSLTKEELRDLTEPKVVETAQVKQESIAKKVIAERLESTKPKETTDAPKEFCVEITKDNRLVLVKLYNSKNNDDKNSLTIGFFLISDVAYSHLSYKSSINRNLEFDRYIPVSTEEFLKNIGREYLIQYDAEKVITNKDEPKQYEIPIDLKLKALNKILQDRIAFDLRQTIIPKDNDYVLGTNFKDDIEFHKKALELSLKAYKDVVLKRDSVIAERNGVIQVPSDLAQTPLTPDECIKPTETIVPPKVNYNVVESSMSKSATSIKVTKENINYREMLYAPDQDIKLIETIEPKKYTIDDMKKCFDESRLTHPFIGFKHAFFEHYLESSK